MGQKLSQELLRAVRITGCAVLIAAGSSAQAGSITFLAPREAVMRHNGAPVRGGVKSITPDEVVVVLRTGVEKSFSMGGVTSIIAADNSFRFYPAQETLDEFLTRSSNLRGVTIVNEDASASAAGGASTKSIGGPSDGYARMAGMQPAAAPQSASSGGGFVQADGFAGRSQKPKTLARFETPTIPELDSATVAAMEEERKAAEIEASTPKFALPGGGVTASPSTGAKSSFALPPPGEDVLICSNPACMKEVPGAKYGQKCPHCGIIWAHQSTADIVASSAPGTSTPVVDPRNPFARAAAPAPAATALPPTVAPAAAAPVAVADQEMTLQNLPWWGKVLGFGASIMVLMWILGRR